MKYPNLPPHNITQDSADKAFDILQLWYREAYEESARVNQRLQSEVSFWATKYSETKKSRDLLRQSNRVQQSRIYELESTVHVKDRFIREIFAAFPDARNAYEITLAEFQTDESETESEPEAVDLRDLPVRRRLSF